MKKIGSNQRMETSLSNEINSLPTWAKGLIPMGPNRVYRTYKGGKYIEGFKGNSHGKDGYFPEEWLTSLVCANSGVENEGLSYCEVAGEKVSLKSMIENYPEHMLGKGHMTKYGRSMGVLSKLLDAAERLTIQVHPNNEMAKGLFGGEVGKTEAWHILGFREENLEKPCVYIGFKPNMTMEKWERLFARQKSSEMLEALNCYEVNVGETYLVPGGVPHAIGKGCFLLEVQQPCDYTIRTERVTPSGLPIPDHLCHQGLGFEKMLECFLYQGYQWEEMREAVLLSKRVLWQDSQNTVEELIGPRDTPYFGLKKITVQSSVKYKPDNSFETFVVTKGKGMVSGIFTQIIQKGDSYYLPAAIDPFEIVNQGEETLEILSCLPPQ